MLGRVMELQPLYEAASLRGWEGLIQSGRRVSAEFVQNHRNYRHLRLVLIHQRPHLLGKILVRTP
jgi:hypothetical protein